MGNMNKDNVKRVVQDLSKGAADAAYNGGGGGKISSLADVNWIMPATYVYDKTYSKIETEYANFDIKKFIKENLPTLNSVEAGFLYNNNAEVLSIKSNNFGNTIDSSYGSYGLALKITSEGMTYTLGIYSVYQEEGTLISSVQIDPAGGDMSLTVEEILDKYSDTLFDEEFQHSVYSWFIDALSAILGTGAVETPRDVWFCTYIYNFDENLYSINQVLKAVFGITI